VTVLTLSSLHLPLPSHPLTLTPSRQPDLPTLPTPQAFAEKLFSRLQVGNEAFDTRMAILSVVSRVIGTHK